MMTWFVKGSNSLKSIHSRMSKSNLSKGHKKVKLKFTMKMEQLNILWRMVSQRDITKMVLLYFNLKIRTFEYAILMVLKNTMQKKIQKKIKIRWEKRKLEMKKRIALRTHMIAKIGILIHWSDNQRFEKVNMEA